MKQMFFFAPLALSFCMDAQTTPSSALTMLVGTYTNGSSIGIYTYRFNTEDLSVQPLSYTTIDNPSYLTVTPDANFVYAVSESGNRSSISAFTFNKSAGTLHLLNNQQVGAGPCFILYHEATRTVVTANYTGGSVSITRLAADGRLTDSLITFPYEGQGTIQSRQSKPHLHCIAVTPDGQSLFATDLGTDKIHKIDISKTPNGELSTVFRKAPSFTLESGSGPRHIVFNKKHTFAYLINELSGMVSALSVDASNNLKICQTILADTLHAGGSADIHLSVDEQFLYASTRLKGDGIVIFRVNDDGTLKRIGYQATYKHPRNFAITPDGNRMLVACKDSGVIQIFNINRQTGLLSDSGKTIEVDQPVCIQFVP